MRVSGSVLFDTWGAEDNYQLCALNPEASYCRALGLLGVRGFEIPTV